MKGFPTLGILASWTPSFNFFIPLQDSKISLSLKPTEMKTGNCSIYWRIFSIWLINQTKIIRGRNKLPWKNLFCWSKKNINIWFINSNMISLIFWHFYLMNSRIKITQSKKSSWLNLAKNVNAKDNSNLKQYTSYLKKNVEFVDKDTNITFWTPILFYCLSKIKMKITKSM